MYADYIKPMLEALLGSPQQQTNLTELVWGTSGRGNASLVNIVFMGAIDRKLVEMRQRGRAKVYEITDKGRQWLVDEQEVIDKIRAALESDAPTGNLDKSAYRKQYDVWAAERKYLFVNRQRMINFHRHEQMSIDKIAEYVRAESKRVA